MQTRWIREAHAHFKKKKNHFHSSDSLGHRPCLSACVCTFCLWRLVLSESVWKHAGNSAGVGSHNCFRKGVCVWGGTSPFPLPHPPLVTTSYTHTRASHFVTPSSHASAHKVPVLTWKAQKTTTSTVSNPLPPQDPKRNSDLVKALRNGALVLHCSSGGGGSSTSHSVCFFQSVTLHPPVNKLHSLKSHRCCCTAEPLTGRRPLAA